MMKSLFALCVVLAFSQALTVSQTNWYSGSVNVTGTPQSMAVNTAVSPCAALTTATGYQNFTLNVTTAGFYYFTALFEKTFISSAQIQVYSAPFVPSASCTGLLYATGSGSGVPHLEFLLWLGVGLYPVVVTGSNPANLGLFSVHVDMANFNGASNELTSHWWNAPYGSSSCSDSSYPGTFVSYSWAQTTTVDADLLFFAYNASGASGSSFSFAAALYNSSNIAFLSVGNRTNPTSACNANFVTQRDDGNSDLTFNLKNSGYYQATAALAVSLTGGLNFTVAIGTYDSTVLAANFGFWMRPTAQGVLGSLLFTAPTVPAYSVVTDCTPGNDKYFASYWFSADYNSYIIDNPSDSFDTAGCLYRGFNLGNATAAPATCPNTSAAVSFVACGDTGDGGPVASFLNLHQNYTWVQIPYSYPGTTGAKFLLYSYGGKLLGTAPVMTTGAPVVTSAAASTSANENSHSDASSVVVTIALTIVAMFF